MYLVLDVGGTFVKYAIMNAKGEILVTDKYPTNLNGEDQTDSFLNSISELYQKYDKEYTIEGIAVSLPGQVDIKNGIVYGGGTLKFLDKQRVGQMISEKCNNIPVSLENDGKCCALCESWFGNAKDVPNAYVLVIGTGVGGGMIIDHKVHHGSSLIAGEVSYLIDNMSRSQADSILTAEEIKGELPNTLDHLPFIAGARCATGGVCNRVAKIKNMPFNEVNGELIYKWAHEGDKEIIEVIEDWYFEIAKSCINIYLTFNPDIILIGGGISVLPEFIEGIEKYVNKIKRMTHILDNIKLGSCKYRNRSNLYGAFINFKQLYEI